MKYVWNSIDFIHILFQYFSNLNRNFIKFFTSKINQEQEKNEKRSKFSLTYIIFANKWFERVSMLVILLNCVTLGMYQPCVDDECKTNRCKILQVSTIYFPY
jgi:hypothetical protein